MAIGIYLRSLLAPDRSRWQPMLMGLALFAAGVGAAVSFQPPAPLAAVLIVLALAAWVTGACAMVGYVRWFIASEIARAKKDNE
jgi:hypothetical protein